MIQYVMSLTIFAKYDSEISVEEFESLIPQIDRLGERKQTIEKQAAKVEFV